MKVIIVRTTGKGERKSGLVACEPCEHCPAPSLRASRLPCRLRRPPARWSRGCLRRSRPGGTPPPQAPLAAWTAASETPPPPPPPAARSPASAPAAARAARAASHSSLCSSRRSRPRAVFATLKASSAPGAPFALSGCRAKAIRRKAARAAAGVVVALPPPRPAAAPPPRAGNPSVARGHPFDSRARRRTSPATEAAVPSPDMPPRPLPPPGPVPLSVPLGCGPNSPNSHNF